MTRPRTGVLLVGLAVVALVAAATVAATAVGGLPGALAAGAEPSPGPKDVRLVDLETEGERLWPYTSRHADFGSRTLAINVLVYEDPERVRYRLERRSDVEWIERNESEETANFSVELSESRVGFVWRPAHGSLRYTYVEREETGRWLPQRYQLHAGTYLGTRSHVRAYALAGDSDWTAIQAHREYWDWFRLRHSVTDVWETGRTLEEDFADQPLVSDVQRAHATDRGPTAEGITVVYVAWALFVASVPPVRRRFDSLAAAVGRSDVSRRRSLALFGVAGGVPLGVRAAGLGLEHVFTGVTPKVIAAPLYVLLVVGLPVAVYRLSDDVAADRALAFAAVGFLVGVWLDYLVVGVVDVPARHAVHRLLLAVALGAIAAGSRERGAPRATLVAGTAVWSGAVLGAVLGLL